MVISESLHILSNRGEGNENKLLHNGLSFVVEEETEEATSLEEVQALKIRKLLKMIHSNAKPFEFMTKETLY